MPPLAAGQFLLTLLVVAGLVACAVALGRRGRPSWLAPGLGVALLAGFPVALWSARERKAKRATVPV
jgi:hypothetical protein